MPSIFIKHVSPDIKKQDIVDVYTKHVKVLDVRVKDNKAKPPHFWKYAFVDVLHEDLKKALAVPTIRFGTRAEASITKNSGRLNDSDDTVSEDPDDDIAVNSIIVTDLPMDVNIGRLRSYFSKFGKLENLSMIPNKTNDGKMHAVVRFVDQGACVAACRRVDHVIDQKYVMVRGLDPNLPNQQVMWFDKALGRLNFVLGNFLDDESEGNSRMRSSELLRKMAYASRMESVVEEEAEVAMSDKRRALVRRTNVCDTDSDSSDLEDMNPTLDIVPQDVQEAMRRYQQDCEARNRRSTDSGVHCSPELLSQSDTDIDVPRQPIADCDRSTGPKPLSCGRGTGILGLPGRGRPSADSPSTIHTITDISSRFASFGRGFRRA